MARHAADRSHKKGRTAWTFDRPPGGGKKRKKIPKDFEPEYDFKIQGMAPVDFGTNDFVASIAERQEINPEFANLLGKP